MVAGVAQQSSGARGGMFGMMQNSAHGTVTSIAGDEINIRDEEGQVYRVITGPNTHFRKDREDSRLSDIHPGDIIVAAGNLDEQAKTVGAAFVVVLSPEQAKRMKEMRANFGKTWTAGRVTAIQDLTLTIERPDKVGQRITVDENTIFRKRDQDITFPEIKVGDRVMARGTLQSGNFLASSVAVMGARRSRDHGPDSTPQPPAGDAPSQPQR